MRISDWSSDVCSSDLAVHIGQRLEVGLVFAELLGAAVKEADVRVDALNDLAVELEDEAQHAVRGGVLRAEVDRVVGDFDIDDGRVGGLGLAFDLFEIFSHAPTVSTRKPESRHEGKYGSRSSPGQSQ